MGSYFSAGLLDLVLSYQYGEHSFWLIPGILFFVIYALLFSRLLEHAPSNLPGKPIAEELPQLATVAPRTPDAGHPVPQDAGGMDNLQAMSVCLTRLSLRVREMALVDQSCLARLGCLPG